MKKIFSVILLLLIGCNSAQSRKLAQENLAAYPWQFVTPMPHGRYGHDAVYAANGKIYIMGGLVFKVAKGFKKDGKFNSWLIAKYNNGRYSNLAYDPKIDQWEYMMCVPGWRSGFIKYDPNTDQWNEYEYLLNKYSEEEILKMSRPIDPKNKPLKLYDTYLWRQGNGLAIALTDNQIFWTGGQSFGGSIENNVLPYDLKTDKWPKKTHKNILNSSAPKPFWEHDQREMYQTTIPPMQEPRRDHRAVTTADGKIYVLGGWHEEMAWSKFGNFYKTGKDIVSKTMECYDPQTNKWEYKKPLSRERMLFAAVVGKDDKIYVFGGVAGFALDKQAPVLNTVEVYDPKIDSWSFRRPMPVHRFTRAAALAADGKIYIIGGSEVLGKPLSSVYIFDSEKDSWEKGPDMILPRSALAAVATPDGKIFAIGGTDVEAYEDKAQWQHLADLFSSAELGDYNGKVQDSVEVLDIYKWRKAKEKK